MTLSRLTRALLVSLITAAFLVSGSVVGAPAEAAGTATVSGTVVGPDGLPVTDASSYGISFHATDGTLLISSMNIDPATGAFSNIYPFTTQPVLVQVYYLGGRPDILRNSWSGPSATFEGASPISLVDGNNVINFTLPKASNVTGDITGVGGTPEGIRAELGGSNSMPTPRIVIADDDNRYSIGMLYPGTYTVSFWDPALVWASKTETFTVTALGQTVEVDTQLTRENRVSGTVSVQGFTGDLTGVRVLARVPGSSSNVATTGVASDGSYELKRPPAGQYEICAYRDPDSPERNWLESCWSESGSAAPTIVTLGATGSIFEDIDIEMLQGGQIAGRVLTKPQPTATPVASQYTNVNLYRYNASEDLFEYFAQQQTDSSGQFAFHAVPPGEYAVQYLGVPGYQQSEFWKEARYWSQRTDIVLEGGESLALGNNVLEPPSLDSVRLSGPDRFATSVDISQATFSDADVADGVPVVYVANGLNYPDALSAGPAAAHQGGGLLLLMPTSIPTVVMAELDRLNPQRIVVVGSADSVSSAVKTQLEAFVDNPGDVDRIGGANRFETSRKIIMDAFEPGSSPNVFIATGLNFPDALSAGPAAAYRGAPVLLVNGSGTGLDSDTKAVLDYLGVEDAFIAGGLPSVSAGVGSSLASYLGGTQHVERYAGTNRFETSIMISVGTFPASENALIAPGGGFADALAGGALAAALGAPIYLSQQGCIPIEVLIDVYALDARRIILLGGEPSLSAAVFNQQPCTFNASTVVSARVAPLD